MLSFCHSICSSMSSPSFPLASLDDFLLSSILSKVSIHWSDSLTFKVFQMSGQSLCRCRQSTQWIHKFVKKNRSQIKTQFPVKLIYFSYKVSLFLNGAFRQDYGNDNDFACRLNSMVIIETQEFSPSLRGLFQSSVWNRLYSYYRIQYFSYCTLVHHLCSSCKRQGRGSNQKPCAGTKTAPHATTPSVFCDLNR